MRSSELAYSRTHTHKRTDSYYLLVFIPIKNYALKHTIMIIDTHLVIV